MWYLRNTGSRFSLHTASPSEIWINQSALSWRQKLYCPDVITQTLERTSLSVLASQNSSFRRAACSLSLIIYNKENGEIFIQSEEENGSRHLWSKLIDRGIGRSFSSSPFGKFLAKEKQLDVCWQTPRTAATLFSVSRLSLSSLMAVFPQLKKT